MAETVDHGSVPGFHTGRFGRRIMTVAGEVPPRGPWPRCSEGGREHPGPQGLRAGGRRGRQAREARRPSKEDSVLPSPVLRELQ